MTLDQLRIFVAVAEREHLTEGARSVNLTPSAATSAIQALEGRHGTKLFHRVGRRLELTDGGRLFLTEARKVLSAAKAAEGALEELSGLTRGRLALAASQTLASHWLPAILTRFAIAHGGIVLTLMEGNTASVAAAVLAGHAELGCIEGEIDEPALAVTPLADDRLVIVGAPQHPLSRLKAVPAAALLQHRWVMREPGSGTRALFEAALSAAGVKPDSLPVVLTLPTNEAVCGAILGSACLTVVSELVAQPFLASGQLHRIAYVLPARRFALVRHKERFQTKASVAFEAMLKDAAAEMVKRRSLPDFEI
jgi:DNA-binding transcriptional LysR family regulator